MGIYPPHGICHAPGKFEHKSIKAAPNPIATIDSSPRSTHAPCTMHHRIGRCLPLSPWAASARSSTPLCTPPGQPALRSGYPVAGPRGEGEAHATIMRGSSAATSALLTLRGPGGLPTGYRLPAIGYRLRTTDYGLRTTGYGLLPMG